MFVNSLFLSKINPLYKNIWGLVNVSVKENYGIRLYGHDDFVLDVDLPLILAEVSQGEKYHWGVNSFEGMPKKEVDEQTLEKFKLLSESEDQTVRMTWKELNDFAASMHQIYDGYFFASQDEALVSTLQEGESLYSSYDILINMIDSSFCDVFTVDVNLIKRLAKKVEIFQIMSTEYLRADPKNDMPLRDIEYFEHHNTGVIPCPHEHRYLSNFAGEQYKGKAKPFEG